MTLTFITHSSPALTTRTRPTGWKEGDGRRRGMRGEGRGEEETVIVEVIITKVRLAKWG